MHSSYPPLQERKDGAPSVVWDSQKLKGWATRNGRLRDVAIGAYTLKRLVGCFTHINAIVGDTPIVDEQARKSISVVELIDSRLERGVLEVFEQPYGISAAVRTMHSIEKKPHATSQHIRRITELRECWQEVRVRLLNGKQ